MQKHWSTVLVLANMFCVNLLGELCKVLCTLHTPLGLISHVHVADFRNRRKNQKKTWKMMERTEKGQLDLCQRSSQKTVIGQAIVRPVENESYWVFSK